MCNGSLIPDLGDALVRLNFVHRVFALATGIGLLTLLFRAGPGLRPLAGLALVLIALQIALGGLVVLLAAPLWSGLVHQAFGVLTFGLLSLLLWRSGGDRSEVLENRGHARLSRA